MKFFTFLFIPIIFLLAISSAFSTTIVPFENLGELAQYSDEIAIVRVVEQTNTNDDVFEYNHWNIQIVQSFKQSLNKNDLINIQSLSGQSPTYFTQVSGDIQLQVGQEYLMFMNLSETGAWTPMAFSYYLYQSFDVDGEKYFVPVKEGLDIHVEGDNNGIQVLNADRIIDYLNTNSVDDYAKEWDNRLLYSNKTLDDFYPTLRTAPSHCTFLNSGGNGFRWNIFPDAPLKVYADTELDNDYSGSHTQVSNAILDLSSAYGGLNLSDQGTVTSNYNPNCSGGSANSGNFINYSNSLNGGDNALFIFNDPCSQISDLSNCSGVLAIGGSYGYTPMHQFDGQNWFTSRHAYLIVNNGTGNCLDPGEYRSVLIHELTHGLGLGHIAASNGSANMNPFCCNDIGSLDIECVDYLYPSTASLTITSTISDASCFNICDGSISINSVTGGNAPYSYNWSNGQSSATISNLCDGNYSVTITDNGSASLIESFNVSEPNLLVTSFNQTNTSCGLNNGIIFVFASGGTNPYFYNWNTGQSSSFINNLSAGNYSVTITDSNGCQETEFISISNSTAVTANAFSTDETANNANDGTATCSPNGGQPPYAYAWSSGQNSQSIINLSPGNYVITVTDNDDCEDIELVTVNAFICPTMTVSTNQQNISCFGECDGLLNINNVNNGLAPFEYQWSNGSTNSLINNLCVGNYSVTITDANNCDITRTYTIIEPLLIDANASSTNETGNNFNDGTATCNPSNGVGNYTYLWSTGQTTQSINNLSPAVYSVTVSDGNGCSRIESTTVLAFDCPILSVNANINNILCFGDCNGAISILNVNNAVAPLTYLWNDGVMSATNNNLCAGVYNVTITDALNCSVIENFIVTQSDLIVVNITATHTSCGLENGMITTNITGGNQPYSYIWDNGANTSSVHDLPAGNYNLTITDSNNCSSVHSVEIEDSEGITLDLTITNESAFGANDGIASLIITGGSAPLSIIWSNGATTNSITDLAPGAYSVTVSDNDGCVANANFEIINFICPELEMDYTVSEISCFEACNGSINVDLIENGNPPYSYLWNNGNTTPNLNDLCADIYSVTITDQSNCTLVQEIVLTAPIALSSTITSIDESANNANDGSANITASGGTFPYTYLWSNGATTVDIADLSPGQYIVTLTDINGCTALDTAIINEFICPNLEVNADIKQNTCYDLCDGSILISSINNGQAPYGYLWSNGLQSDTIENLCFGTFIVTITDQKNCIVIDSFVITQPDSIVSNIIITNESTFEANDGSAMVNPIGGTTPYTYLWSNDSTSNVISDLEPNNYSVTIEDALGCLLVESFVIEAFGCTGLNILNDVNQITCFGQCDGSINISDVENATAPFTYNWSTGNTGNQLDSLCAGQYDVTITDDNNCMVFGSFTIIEPDSLWMNILTTDESIFESNNGSAQVSIFGGTAPYQTEWSNGDSSLVNQNLSPGMYIITITDTNGCYLIDSFSIDSFICPDLNIISNTTDANCYNSCDGEINILDITNTTNPINYTWNNASIADSLNNLCAGQYSLLATDSLNCSIMDTFIINAPLEIDIQLNLLQHINGSTLGSIDINVGNNEGYTFQWVGPNQFTSTSQNISNLDEEGCYSVLVSDSLNCQKDSVFCINDITSNEIVEELSNVIVYPNPANDILNIDFGTNNSIPTLIKVYNVLGQQVDQTKKTVHQNNVAINTSSFEEGLYIIYLETESKFKLFKTIVIQK